MVYNVAPTTPSRPALVAIRLIRGYQAISRLTPPMCRFHPTCSQYGAEAIARHGLLRGAALTTVRLCKCHPFHPGGLDPVPD